MLAAHSNNLAGVGTGILVEGSQGGGMLAGEQGQEEIGLGSGGIAGRVVGHTLVMNG